MIRKILGYIALVVSVFNTAIVSFVLEKDFYNRFPGLWEYVYQKEGIWGQIDCSVYPFLMIWTVVLFVLYVIWQIREYRKYKKETEV